jgi:hypothetical protein
VAVFLRRLHKKTQEERKEKETGDTVGSSFTEVLEAEI